MRTSILKPGLLVALKSTVTGGVAYRRVDLDAPAEGSPVEGEAKREVSRWETTRIVDDPEEHERAVKVRGKALSEIRSVCVISSAFGCLCPMDREAELDDAVRRARALVEDFNATARCTRVTVNTIKGRIASTDEEAIRSITGEMSYILANMNRAIDKMDPVAIRGAATEAARMSAMLDESQVQRVSDAVIEARKAARLITKRVEKAGESAASVMLDIQRGAIERARFAFLDTEEVNAPAGNMPAANVQRFAELDACGDDAPASEPPSESGEPASEPGEVIAASA
jgi:hypothetical protein